MEEPPMRKEAADSITFFEKICYKKPALGYFFIFALVFLNIFINLVKMEKSIDFCYIIYYSDI